MLYLILGNNLNLLNNMITRILSLIVAFIIVWVFFNHPFLILFIALFMQYYQLVDKFLKGLFKKKSDFLLNAIPFYFMYEEYGHFIPNWIKLKLTNLKTDVIVQWEKLK